MTSKLLNLTICALLVQFVSSCAAQLSEQCRQIKVADSIMTESFYAHEKETDPKKKSELLSQSFREKAKVVRNLSLSDSYLKNIQEKLIKNKEGFADSAGFEETTIAGFKETIRLADESIRLANESKAISNDLKNYCQS